MKSGDSVEFIACVNVAGDTNTANNCDSETRTARGKCRDDDHHGHHHAYGKH